MSHLIIVAQYTEVDVGFVGERGKILWNHFMYFDRGHFNQTVGPGQVTLFERIIAFVRVTVELQLCGKMYIFKKLPV